MQETQGQSLNQKDPLEKGRQPTPVCLPGKSYGDSRMAGYSLWDRRVRHDLVTNAPPHFLDTDYGLLPASGSGNTKSLTLEGSYDLKKEKGLCLDVANMVLNVL